MSQIKHYRSKLIKSLLDTMGAVFLRNADPTKEDLSNEEVNSRIDNILDKYTEDLLTEEPYSPIKFGRWILKSCEMHTDADGFINWHYAGLEVDTVTLYEMYKTEMGL